MSLLFLSHSSANNSEALALRDWLVFEGWTDLFLDLDPERGIVAGERWERALYQAAGRCDTVLTLISRAWLSSDWCRRELQIAQRLNKRVVALLIEDIPVSELPLELTESWQVVSLATKPTEASSWVSPGDGARGVAFSRDGLTRLKVGLRKAGLDPHSFPFPPANDPQRPPYRGLRPLMAEDAGTFFGREGPIIELLAQLRGLTEAAPPRLLAILGASGAGKSSFLRAGILPRLARDNRHYLPLPVIRPERAVMSGQSGLLDCLREACKTQNLALSRKQLSDVFERGAPALRTVLNDLAEKAAVPDWDGGDTLPPTLVLSIDQGEELFQAEGGEEAKRFLGLLGELLTEESPKLLAVFTIRSDSYDSLQSATELQGISQKTFSLPPMPKGSYRQIIEEPAKLLASSSRPLKVDPKLTEALMQDMERGGAKDALPLLAFTLERLYLDYGDAGDLRLDQYVDLGRIEGAIETAVELALKDAQQNPKLPRDRHECLNLLRRGLIPWLAGIDPNTNLPRRKVSKLSQVPEEARALIQHFIEHRLLATDTDEHNETTVEPAHEALLRQWNKLRGWLEDDAVALSTLESIKAASRDWEANERDNKWLVHQTGRLEDAEALHQRADLAANLDSGDRLYLTECRKQDEERRDEELRQARALAEAQRRTALRTRIGLMVATVLTLVSSLLGWQAYRQQQVAEVQTQEAETQLVEANHNLGRALVEKADARNAETRHQQALYFRAHAAALLRPDASRANLTKLLGDLHRTSLPVWSSTRGGHHENLVNTVAFSPDGRQLASGSYDSTIKLWDAVSGELGQTLKKHSDSVNSIAFSPDGNQLASGSDDATINLWDAASGSLLRTLEGHSGSVDSVAFSSDGRELASGSYDATIKIWDPANGVLLRTFEGLSNSVSSVAFSPVGGLLASGLEDGKIHLWDSGSGELLRTLEGYSEPVSGIAFSPDGSQLATSSWDGKAKLWAVSGELLLTLEVPFSGESRVAFSPDGRQLAVGQGNNSITLTTLWELGSSKVLRTLRGHSFGVASVAFSADGRQLATGENNTINLWDIASGESLSMLGGHSLGVNSTAFSPDGGQFVSGSEDTTIKLWDAATGELLRTLEGHSFGVRGVTFSPNGSQLASGSEDGALKLWDLANGELLRTLEGHTDAGLYSVVFSPNGSKLASGGNTIKLWDSISGELLSTLDEHSERVWSIGFSPNGNQLVSGSEDGTIKVWDTANGNLLRTLAGHSLGVRTVAFSPDGSQLASGSVDTKIKLWNTESGKLLRTLEGHYSEFVYSVAFSPDGRWLASGLQGGMIKFWDTASGELLQTLEGHSTNVNSVAFSSDGSRLVSASDDYTIKLWDTASIEIPQKIEGHSDSVASVVFSPDGRQLASGSEDDTIKLWDSDTGEFLRTLEGRSSGISSVAFNPDGSLLASGSGNETIEMWDVASGELLRTLEESYSPVSSVAFSPDGRELVSGSMNRMINVWDTFSGELLRTLEGHRAPVSSVVFGPEGSQLASSSWDYQIKLWDYASGKVLHTLDGHSAGESSVAFSPDGSQLASGSTTIKIWNAASGELLRTLLGSATGVAFSPDGSRLVSGSADGTISLWDSTSGQFLCMLDSRSGSVRSVAFSPDGTQVASGSSDNSVKLWNLTWMDDVIDERLPIWIEQQKRVTDMRLVGLDIEFRPLLRRSLFENKSSTGLPVWRKTDPLRWLPGAREGNVDAMIEAGNGFMRREQYDQARHWFNQAQALSDPRAVERLQLVNRAIERASKSAKTDNSNR